MATWFFIYIGSGSGLVPCKCQAITWINIFLLFIGPVATKLSEIRSKYKNPQENAFENVSSKT